MLEQDLQLVEAAFKKYYFENFDLLLIPERASEREFGYQKFNGGMNRHIPHRYISGAGRHPRSRHY